LTPVFLHAPYVVNLGTQNPRLWGLSVRLLREELRRAPVLGAHYVLLHPGRWGQSNPVEALWRVIEGLSLAVRACPEDVRLALENTAGQKGELGSSLEELALIRNAVGQEKVALMFDVAHLYEAGYAVDEHDGLEGTLARVEELVGLENVAGLHMNDSRTPRGSRVDRHWHLGEGEIGFENLARIVRHSALSHMPAIMETPRHGVEDDLRNMSVFRAMMGE
jgi:deoxyribonuclease-4